MEIKNENEIAEEMKNNENANDTEKVPAVRKTLRYVSKRDMKKLCEELKIIGTKYKIKDNEKNTVNDVLYLIQTGWTLLNVNDEIIIQM